MMKVKYSAVVGMVLTGLLAAGCQTAPETQKGKDILAENASLAMDKMYRESSNLKKFVEDGAGYVVFPRIGKAGLIFAGAYGDGIVYEKGQMIGYADISQATVGLQAGGQEYTELVVFETQNDLDKFKKGKFTFAANASAVILKSGAATAFKYSDGVSIIVRPVAGGMVEAAIGGQSFDYVPKEEAMKKQRVREKSM